MVGGFAAAMDTVSEAQRMRIHRYMLLRLVRTTVRDRRGNCTTIDLVRARPGRQVGSARWVGLEWSAEIFKLEQPVQVSRSVRFFTNNQYEVIFEPNNKSYFFYPYSYSLLVFFYINM